MFYHALTGNGGTTPTEDLEPVLLWENSNPSAEFAAQTISLDLTDYAGIIVECYTNITISVVCSRGYIKKTDNTNIGVGTVYDSDTFARGRRCNVTNDGVVFYDARTGSDTSNEAVIPYRIYGVKDYVVEPNYAKFTINILNDAGNNTIEQNIFKSAKVINTSSGDSTRDIILSDTNGNTVTIAKGKTKVVDISNFEKLSWSTTESVFVNGTIELTLKGGN